MKSIAIDTSLKEAVLAALKQGKSASVVSAELGVNPKTIQTWKRRAGLLKLEQEQSKEAEKVERISETVREKLSKQVLRLTHGMEKLSLGKSAKSCAIMADLLNKVVTPADKLFAWSVSTTQVFNFNLLDSMKLAKAESAQPIDVEQVKTDNPPNAV